MHKNKFLDKFLLILQLSVVICLHNTYAQDIDILKSQAEVRPDYDTKSISGSVDISFMVTDKTDQVNLDAQDMEAELIDASHRYIGLESNSESIIIKGKFKPDKKYSVSINFSAKPQQALYFVPFRDTYQIWTQGQGKDTSHWLPTHDDMNDKAVFDLSIISPREMSVVANGRLQKVKTINENEKRWQFKMEKPMSAYLLSFAIGNFVKKVDKDQDLAYYLDQNDSIHFEPTFRNTKKIYRFLEEKTGFTYPWQNYKQVAIKDFLYAGMENTSCTLFSDAFVVDSIGYFDRNYVNVNAHEMAHQWFGNLVTEKSSKHHWLHEGFATYYALLAEQRIFGEDYFYFKLYQNAKQLYDRSNKGDGEQVISENASSLTYYQAGAWALHALHDQLTDDKFDDIISTYLERNKFRNVTTSDFLKVVAEKTDIDTLSYKNDWLEQTAFQGEKALNILKRNKTIKDLMELEGLRKASFSEKKAQLEKALQPPIDQFLGQEAVYQLPEPTSDDITRLYLKAFSADELIVRQAISERLREVPASLRENFETLLDDRSYLTQKNALLHLWLSFPDKRKAYLDMMKNVQGFKDHNIRTLWLTLAIATNTYQPEASYSYFQELVSYTASERRYQTRRNAFQYLSQIDSFNKKAFKNLIKACAHHNWRFRKFCRELFDKLLEKKKYESMLSDLALNEKDQGIVDKLVKR